MAQVHHVYGADQSGFRTSFQLGSQLATLGQVQLISRYTDAANGNSNSYDYWFAPVTINRSNRAHLDGVTVDGNQLIVNGWHATNLAANKPYHYVIVVDQTSGREVGRCLVKPVARPDVAQAFSGVMGAATAGFQADFSLNQFNLNHRLQVLSRYSASADGNRDYVDYWFVPITTESEENRGNLDGYRLANGQSLVVSGWHATNRAQLETHHFLILYDQTANQQTGVVVATTVARPDVARAYPSIGAVGRSGFTGSFDLQQLNLVAGHTYAVVSRYSTSDQGNGSQGQYLTTGSAH